MKIYCDTNVLPWQIREPENSRAMATLLEQSRAGKLSLYVSNRGYLEINETPDAEARQQLVREFKELKPVPNDERHIGFCSNFDETGGFSFPLYSEVQDEKLRDELVRLGLKFEDANHVAQAISNDCRVFLTRDQRTILKHRSKIEAQFPIRILWPFELVEELAA